MAVRQFFVAALTAAVFAAPLLPRLRLSPIHKETQSSVESPVQLSAASSASKTMRRLRALPSEASRVRLPADY